MSTLLIIPFYKVANKINVIINEASKHVDRIIISNMQVPNDVQ
jgi:hypothetical protein